MNKKKHYVIYLFIYKLMRDKSRNNLFINYHCTKELLNKRLYFLPKRYRWVVLGELEELKLIKKIGSGNKIGFKFIGRDADKLLRKYNPIF